MIRRPFLLAGLVVVLAAACAGGSRPSATPGPSTPPGSSASPGSSPTSSPVDGPLTSARLKLAIVHRFGSLWYCDPDYFPVARNNEERLAIQRFGEVQADAEAFAAILAELKLNGGAFTDTQKLDIYRAWKQLNAIALDPIGNDTYRFDYLAQPATGAAQGTRTAGTITTAGAITIEQQAAAGEPMCPICLARGTRVDTPTGRVAVEALRIGDSVWTLDANGLRIPGAVIALGSTQAPLDHHVVHVVLVDGRTVTASPGHPLADGRRLGDLRPGDRLAGSVVFSADLVAYTGGRTFDIAVGGPTGAYLVDGIPLGSTLDLRTRD